MQVNPTKRLVYGEGDKDASIVIVGEAPGATEVKLGRPFVGQSGQVLDNLLSNAGIPRSACYITNVVKEQPPNNDIEVFFKTQGQRVFCTPEFNAYVRALHEELWATDANVYVAVGNTALYALTQRHGIMKWRGSILQGFLEHNGQYRFIKVVPTIHPATALRQYIFVHYISFDLRRVREEATTREAQLPERHIRLRPSFNDCLSFLERCSASQMLAFDIEVMNGEVSCISFAYSPTEAISIPFMESGYRDYFTLDQEYEIWRAIGAILENENIQKVGQNVAFDATFLFRKYGFVTRPIQDTMVAQAILYPDFPKGLDFITSIWTREPYYKDEGKKWFRFGGSDEDFWLYNAKDSAVCLEAFPKIYRELQAQGNVEAYERQLRVIEPCIFMQEKGILVDVEGLTKASVEAEEEIKSLTDELRTCCGYDVNPNSPNQLKDYFYGKKKVQPYFNRKTGSASVDGQALKRLSRRGFKEADLLLRLRKLTKLKGTYYDVTLDDDGRLRCSFNPVGTTTGRLSSSETIFETGTNMQNLPPEMLRFLLADAGYISYLMDLSQAENRTLAYIAPEPSMIRAFENGIDLHRQTAALIFNKALDQVSDEDGSAPIGGGTFSERFWGKKANHSLNYDFGFKSFALLYEIPEADAKFIVDRYHTVYPGVRAYHAWVRSKLSKTRTLENCFGRKRLFLDRWGDELFKEAYAYIPQSTVAEKLNDHGLCFVYYNQQWFYPVELLNQIHDALAFQISTKHDFKIHAECILRIRDSLESPISWGATQFSIPVDLKVGFGMDKKKSKEVKLREYATVEGLARLLSDLHGEYRASIHV